MGTNIDKTKGKIKQAIGDLTDNPALKREGERDEIKGKVEGALGDVKNAAKDAAANVKKAAKDLTK